LGPLSRQDPNAANPAVYAEYLVAEFNAESCDYLRVPFTIRYESEIESPDVNISRDFSRTIILDLPHPANAPNWTFFPVYYTQTSNFKGIEIYHQGAAACLTGLYRVKDLSKIPLLLTLTLPPGWEQVTRYQTMAKWETSRIDTHLSVYTLPEDLPVGLSLLKSTPSSLEHNIVFQADTVKTETNRWIIKGPIEQQYSPLVQMHDKDLRMGSYFMAQGELYEGGLRFVLLNKTQAEQWVDQVEVADAGRFTVIIEIPDDGIYSIKLANHLKEHSLKNDFIITGIGWVEE